MRRGFTLIEIMVALAIAAGALVLILSAVTSGFRKGARARLSERLQVAAESKFAECLLGSEKGSDGVLPGFDGHRWEVRSTRESVGPLKKTIRLTFTVSGPGGNALVLTQLSHPSGEPYEDAAVPGASR